MAKKQGHYCKVCGQHKSNESLSGKGHNAHICKKCAALSPADRARPVWLWQLREENADHVSAMLEQSYDIPGNVGLAEQLEQAATQLVREYWDENHRDIFDIVADSFLDGYDDYNIEVAFQNAAVVSTT